MSIRELEKNKKYQIEIVLGYLENKKKKRLKEQLPIKKPSYPCIWMRVN